jgi:hypothetical protein
VLLFEVTTPGELAHFIERGRPGQTALYHVGFLACDSPNSWASGNAHLPELRKIVWANRRRLNLTQKRLGEFVYEYRCQLPRQPQ